MAFSRSPLGADVALPRWSRPPISLCGLRPSIPSPTPTALVRVALCPLPPPPHMRRSLAPRPPHRLSHRSLRLAPLPTAPAVRWRLPDQPPRAHHRPDDYVPSLTRASHRPLSPRPTPGPTHRPRLDRCHPDGSLGTNQPQPQPPPPPSFGPPARLDVVKTGHSDLVKRCLSPR